MKCHPKICCNRLDYHLGCQSIIEVIFQNQIVLNTFAVRAQVSIVDKLFLPPVLIIIDIFFKFKFLTSK